MSFRQVDPGRLVLANYPLRSVSATERSTVAAGLHVSNIALAALYDARRTALLHQIYTPELRLTGMRPLLVETTLAYRAEVVHPCEVAVTTAAGPMGRSSFVLLQAQFVGSRCVGLCDSTFVNIGGSGAEALAAPHQEVLTALAWRVAEPVAP